MRRFIAGLYFAIYRIVVVYAVPDYVSVGGAYVG